MRTQTWRHDPEVAALQAACRRLSLRWRNRAVSGLSIPRFCFSMTGYVLWRDAELAFQACNSGSPQPLCDDTQEKRPESLTNRLGQGESDLTFIGPLIHLQLKVVDIVP